MLFADIGGFFLLACVLFTCLIIPIWMTTHERPTLEPVRRRQAFLRWAAGLSALPLPAILFWDYLGIPPSHPAFIVYPLFFVALFTPLVLLFLKAQLSTGSSARVILTFIAYVLVVMIEAIAPLVASILDIHCQPISHAAQPLTPNPCGDDAVKPLLAPRSEARDCGGDACMGQRVDAGPHTAVAIGVRPDVHGCFGVDGSGSAGGSAPCNRSGTVNRASRAPSALIPCSG
jgi:hypothetical protein